jgi:two-component system nitrogen regulation response regulator NtrX
LQCLKAIQECPYDLILLEIKKPNPLEFELLKTLTKDYPNIPIIMMSAHEDMYIAFHAMQNGAVDVIFKPIDLNTLMTTVRKTLSKSNMPRPSVKGQPISPLVSNQMPLMIGKSPKMKKLKSQLERIAAVNIRVMITGPNGAGKELVAQNLHYASPRAEGPFVAVNCSAFPEQLVESMLFGHEKGAFTDAHKTTKGKFEEAHGGTLFLDEIGDMSPAAQAKVLRALETQCIRRIGGSKNIPVDCRVVAATNKDLYQMIMDSTFREDLYFRLAVIKIEVPALNDRREDVPALAHHFIESFCKANGWPVRAITSEAMKALQEFDYRGNIRELRNIIQRVLVLGSLEIGEEDIFELA